MAIVGVDQLLEAVTEPPIDLEEGADYLLGDIGMEQPHDVLRVVVRVFRVLRERTMCARTQTEGPFERDQELKRLSEHHEPLDFLIPERAMRCVADVVV